MISWQDVEAWARQRDKMARPPSDPYFAFLNLKLNVLEDKHFRDSGQMVTVGINFHF